jgi:hypothetical protein
MTDPLTFCRERLAKIHRQWDDDASEECSPPESAYALLSAWEQEIARHWQVKRSMIGPDHLCHCARIWPCNTVLALAKALGWEE